MGVFERVMKAAWNEIVKPESFAKGDEFESFVRTNLFTKDKYQILHRTHDYTSNKNDYIENTKEPDLKLKSVRSGKEFYVEAKYRSRFINQEVEWCKPYQFKRYKDIDNKTPVYIVIGVGNEPRAPEHVFLAPVKDIKYTKLFRSFITRYEIPADESVDERRLQLI